MEASFRTILGLGTTGRFTVRKWNEETSDWVTLSSTVDGGLLDLLGAAGSNVAGSAEFTEPGRYQVYALTQGVLEVGTTIKLDAVVTTFNPSVIGGFGAHEAAGNVISAGTHDSTTLVTHVNGQAVTGLTEPTVITGTYGTLAIDVYGNYTYTPFEANAGIGKVEAFTYTIRNAAGASDTGTLYVKIDSPGQGLVWSEDPTQPATVILDADDDAAVAYIDTAYKVTTGGPAGHGQSDTMPDGPATRTATLTFTVESNSKADVRIKAVSPGETVNNVEWTVTVTGPGGYSKTYGKTDSSGGYWVGFTLDKALSDLAAGEYTITATFNAKGGLTYVNNDGAPAVLIDYNFLTVTHFDEFVIDDIAPVTGNVLADDTIISSYTKLLVKNEDGVFVEVTSDTTVAGEYGVLTIKKDGSYTYQANAELDDIGQDDVFTYRLQHPNGAVSDANLTITIEHGEGPYEPPASGADAESAMFQLLAFGGGGAELAGEDGDNVDVNDLLEDSDGNVDLDALGVPPGKDAEGLPETGTVESDPYHYVDPLSPDSEWEEPLQI